jgi:hypothetical protein
MCASSGALAADVSSTINPLAEATKVMDRCAAIAHKISSTPVPAGHGEAVAAAFHNQEVAKAHAAANPGKQPAPEHLKPIPPDQQAFFTMIRAERDALQKCGEDFTRVHKPANALMKTAGDALEKEQTKTATEDHKKLGAAMMAYSKSSENLTVAIASLSKDVNHQRYLGGVVDKYFLVR